MSTTRTNDNARLIRCRYRTAKRNVIRQCVNYMCDLISNHDKYSKYTIYVYINTEEYDRNNPVGDIYVKCGVTTTDSVIKKRKECDTRYIASPRFGDSEYITYPVVHGWCAFPADGKTKNYWETQVNDTLSPWLLAHQVPKVVSTSSWNPYTKRPIVNAKAYIQTNRIGRRKKEAKKIHAADAEEFVQKAYEAGIAAGGFPCIFITDFERYQLPSVIDKDEVDLFAEEQTIAFFLGCCLDDESSTLLYQYLFEGDIDFSKLDAIKKLRKDKFAKRLVQARRLRDESWEKVRSTYTEEDYDYNSHYEWIEKQYWQFRDELEATDYQVICEDIRILRSALINLEKDGDGTDLPELSEDN